MKRTILSVRGLKTWFQTDKGPVKALDGIDFDLHERETLCIVGESGSGKSVTARSIMQIVERPGRIIDGQILLHRHDAADDKPSDTLDIARLKSSSARMRDVRRRDISMIFQEPMSSLSPVHRCGDQIVEAIRLAEPIGQKAAWARAVDLIGQMQMPNPDKVAKQYPFELSGGMRQRVMIAMALAKNPRILIADEPTTALDVTTQAEILSLIRELQDKFGLAVIFITHDMGVVAQIADRVAVMHRGHIVEQNDVFSIFNEAEHPYTRMLLSATVRLETRSPLKSAPASQPQETRAAQEPLLRVRDLAKRFVLKGGLFEKNPLTLMAVDGVSFDLYPGETLGVVGESGSGKSTMARCIVGLHQASGGSIAYRRADDSVVDMATYRRQPRDPLYRDIRMIFQDPFASLNPRMTVSQIIGEPLMVNGIARKQALRDRVAELLELVGLDPRMAERYPHAFSGGQRQRIVIARAIALNPRLIVADEATSALDGSLRAQMLDLLIELQERLNLSYIFITHDISTVRYFCDRVVVMHQGRAVESGTVAEVLDAPTEAYTRQLIAAVPRPNPEHRTAHQTPFTSPSPV